MTQPRGFRGRFIKQDTVIKDHPLYSTWLSMRTRCNDRNSRAYYWYGKRGITVCERWGSFQAFAQDMGERPDGLTLDRIDNDGNYEPGNCRWATKAQQRKNTSYREESYPTLARWGPRVTHCKRGHEYNEINTQVRPNNRRACLRCIAITAIQRKLKHKENI